MQRMIKECIKSIKKNTKHKNCIMKRWREGFFLFFFVIKFNLIALKRLLFYVFLFSIQMEDVTSFLLRKMGEVASI